MRREKHRPLRTSASLMRASRCDSRDGPVCDRLGRRRALAGMATGRCRGLVNGFGFPTLEGKWDFARHLVLHD